MDIRVVDPADDAATAAWHATYLAADTHGRKYANPYMLQEVRADLRADDPGGKRHAWSGMLGSDVAVVGLMELPLMDNRDQAWVWVHTLPRLRGRGLGSAMLTHLVRVAEEQGRTVVVAEVAYPYDAPADGAGHPSVDFLRHRGFSLGLAEVQRVVDLPVDDVVLDRLAEEAAPHHEGYTIRKFRGPVPEDLLQSFGSLIGALAVEAPMGELDYEPEVFDPGRIRADEARLAAAGRTKYTTVAVADNGAVVAYSELVVPAHDPGRVYQWGTLVLPEHRGHRLGMATKAHNLRWLQRERADLRLLVTYNAEVNDHMIAINEALGFRPVERLAEFQRKLV